VDAKTFCIEDSNIWIGANVHEAKQLKTHGIVVANYVYDYPWIGAFFLHRIAFLGFGLTRLPQ
jgi:hypothetical protein